MTSSIVRVISFVAMIPIGTLQAQPSSPVLDTAPTSINNCPNGNPEAPRAMLAQFNPQDTDEATRNSAIVGNPKRIAVLLHVAPPYRRSALLRSEDVQALFTMLDNIARSSAVRIVSIWAFNVEQRQILFCQASPGPIAHQELEKGIASLKLATIDYPHLMDKPADKLEFFAGLVNREMAQEPDAVVILGTQTDIDLKVTERALRRIQADRPLFYLHYVPSHQLEFDDVIENLVRKSRGNVFDVTNTKTFLRAWERIEARLGGRRGE